MLKKLQKMLKKLKKTVDIIKGVCYYLIVACERTLNTGVQFIGRIRVSKTPEEGSIPSTPATKKSIRFGQAFFDLSAIYFVYIFWGK